MGKKSREKRPNLANLWDSVGYCRQDLCETFSFSWNVNCTKESENAQPYQHLKPSKSHYARNKSGKLPTTKETSKRWCIPCKRARGQWKWSSKSACQALLRRDLSTALSMIFHIAALDGQRSRRRWTAAIGLSLPNKSSPCLMLWSQLQRREDSLSSISVVRW